MNNNMILMRIYSFLCDVQNRKVVVIPSNIIGKLCRKIIHFRTKKKSLKLT